MSKKIRKCVVCAAPAVGVLLCKACGASYDRTAHNDASIGRAIEWAAMRARRMMRRQAKAKHLK